MPLIENDYDVFGVLFDVRTEGLDSVKGVIAGLVSGEESAKKVQGSLINVKDAVAQLRSEGKSAQEAFDFVAKGGNDLIRFSANAQRAAQDTQKYFQQFGTLEARRQALEINLEKMANNPGISQTAQNMKYQELQQVMGQQKAIAESLAQRRDRDLRYEAMGVASGPSVGGRYSPEERRQAGGLSSAARVVEELGATKPLIARNAEGKWQAATIDDFAEHAKELTGTQKVLREVFANLSEGVRELDTRLSAGQRKWYGEKGGVMRTGAVLDEQGRPQPGSRSRGAESRDATDQVMTENQAKQLTDTRIAMAALRDRVGAAISGDPRQAEVVMEGIVRHAERVRSEAALSLRSYAQDIKPERAMQRQTYALDQLIKQELQAKGQEAGDVSNILYPGAVRKNIDSETQRKRLEGIEALNEKKRNPPTSEAEDAVKSRYTQLIGQARARGQLSDDEKRARSGELVSGVSFFDAYEKQRKTEELVQSLRSREATESYRAKVGPVKFAEERMKSSLTSAELIAQQEQMNQMFAKMFGDRPEGRTTTQHLNDLRQGIVNDPERDARTKRRDLNTLESQYGKYLRAGKQDLEAMDVDKSIAERQAEQREENRNARNTMLDKNRQRQLAKLRGETLPETASATPTQGVSGSTSQAPSAPSANPYLEAYQKAVEESRRVLRSAQIQGSGIKGGSDADAGSRIVFTRPNGLSASYERMLDAERQLSVLGKERARQIEDVETKTKKLAATEASYRDRIAAAADKATAAQVKYEESVHNSVGRIAMNRVEAAETARVAETKYEQAQERTQLAIEQLEAKRAKIDARSPGDRRGSALSRFTSQKEADLALVDKQISARKLVGGIESVDDDGNPKYREGLRSFEYQRSKNQAAAQAGQFELDEGAKVEAARIRAEQLAGRELVVRTGLNTRIKNMNDEAALNQSRDAEDLTTKRELAERQAANSRIKYQQDAERQIETEFSRKSETLGDTLRRSRNVGGEYTTARELEQEALHERVQPLSSTSPSVSAAAGNIEVINNAPKAYERMRGQIAKVYQDLDAIREKSSKEEEEQLNHLATLRLKAAEAPPEFRDTANEALEANRVRSQEHILGLQGQYQDAERNSLEKIAKIRQQYGNAALEEQKARNRQLLESSNQAAFNVTMQFAAAAAAAKALIQETVLYAARTETMRMVTEHMAQANNINVDSINHQVLAVKAMNITTQDANSTIQKMVFAQLDVAKATRLAALAQDAATISGESASEALQKIITGITTGQTRMLHYMGIQVNMNQVLRETREQLGREPTEIEKRQALFNRVLAEGVKISGNFDVAMLTAGKQVLYLDRAVKEAQNAVGAEFQPALMSVISILSKVANFVRENST